MAEEIDLEKCNFRNFRSSVTLTLTLDRVEVILVRISSRLEAYQVVPTHQIRSKSEKKTFCGRTDGPELQSIRSSLGDGLIMKVKQNVSKRLTNQA